MWFRTVHHSTPIASFHYKLTIFLISLCVYSSIISLFYFKNPVRKFRYLSVHIRSKYFWAKGKDFFFKYRIQTTTCTDIQINIFSHFDLGHELSPFIPLFHPESHCNGCDRIRMNAGDTKVIKLTYYIYQPSTYRCCS